MLKTLGTVHGVDAEAREQGLSWEARLQLHQEKSGPLMEGLQQWMTEQLNGHKTEPNSGLGKAMKYLLRHWHQLTLFLRQAGAPLDNNICERALKKRWCCFVRTRCSIGPNMAPTWAIYSPA